MYFSFKTVHLSLSADYNILIFKVTTNKCSKHSMKSKGQEAHTPVYFSECSRLMKIFNTPAGNIHYYKCLQCCCCCRAGSVSQTAFTISLQSISQFYIMNCSGWLMHFSGTIRLKGSVRQSHKELWYGLNAAPRAAKPQVPHPLLSCCTGLSSTSKTSAWTNVSQRL